MNPDSKTQDVFGKVRMGYVLIESRKHDAWRQFAGDALGVHVEQADAALVCRLDAHTRRIVVVDGPAEDVIALGYQLDDDASLQIVLGRLRDRGVTIEEGSTAGAKLRGVECYWRVLGPKGLPIEVFTAPLMSDQSLHMLTSGFCTGAAGLGHVAMTTRRPNAVEAFWQLVFDARVSDRMEDRISGIALDFTFMRLNERHHTVAVASTRRFKLDPVRTRIHHLNIQAATLDDVSAAYRRCRELGYRIALSVGQHPNDREVSFYVVSPSGFYMEYGWAPITVDEASWEPGFYTGISAWGHAPIDMGAREKLAELTNAVRSLLRKEYAPF